MPDTVPSPLQRLVLAFYAFFAILFRAEVAAAVLRLRQARKEGSVSPPEKVPRTIPAAASPPAPATAPAATAANAAPDPRPALQLLSVLQREGRLVDFLEEDLTGFPDAAVGAAARTVHAGCKKALEELVGLEPVLREAEGAQVTIERGFDPAAVRLTGNVVGEPPFRGALRHHGWRVRDVKLPRARDGEDARVVAPAEVEL
jgi:hypothetical protein